jgi:hypothetical protein
VDMYLHQTLVFGPLYYRVVKWTFKQFGYNGKYIYSHIFYKFRLKIKAVQR